MFDFSKLYCGKTVKCDIDKCYVFSLLVIRVLAMTNINTVDN